MTVVVYPALVTAAAPPQLRAGFVDFPGIEISAGSAGELIRLARESLGAELQTLEKAGDTWPEPSDLGSVTVPPGASMVLVDVPVDDTPVRLTISLGERLLKRIDDDAAARSMTRSGYLALGARRMLGDAGAPFGVGGETGKRIQEEIDALGRRLTDALGPESPVGRRLADLDAYALEGMRRLGDEVRAAIRPRGRETPAPAGENAATPEAVAPQPAEH